MLQTAAPLALALAVLPHAVATTYDVLTSHAGSSFFSGLTFFDGYDNTTNGDVFWVQNSSLAYVDSNNRAIIKVDNTTFVPYNEKRNSVKLRSNDWYREGTVFVMDAVHLPYGCSVWPAWWTQGPNWPHGGEIDIIETINQQSTNQYALHTDAGCTPTPNTTFGNPTGQTGTNTCDQSQNYGSGCTVINQNTASAGAGFAAAGGGVYVMAFESTGITIWFYPRSSVPSSLSAGAQTIDTASLGTPSASYSSSSCDIGKFFGSQQMIIDITLCGDYAGNPTQLQQTCPTLATGQTCYTTYVLNSTTYDQAYFEINYINIYGTSNSIDTSLSNGGSVSATASQANPSATTTTTAGVKASASPSGTAGAITGSSGAERVLSLARSGGTAAVVIGGISALAIAMCGV